MTCGTFVDSVDYTFVTKKLREFFDSKGFTEVHTQSRVSILAACEDPNTISTFNYGGQVWPMPQTGQMWLEYELLKNPTAKGFYCQSTSFRNEPNPIPGRHDKIFPMFEYEMPGGVDVMVEIQKELLEFLGFGKGDSFPDGNYVDVARKYGVQDLEHEHETKMREDFGDVYFLKNFPNTTSPFWNMRNNGYYATKVDVIINGVETIGSAERSCDPEMMKELFNTISDGNYRDILYSNFTKERVDQELNEFLEFDFFQRSGGGIGMTRLMKAMRENGLIATSEDVAAAKAEVDEQD
jgi:aspartyl/asparaginyl-tRNA synthetase